jgi:hypothetical protein
MRRIVWFAAGAAAGAGGTVYAGKKVKRVAHEAAERLKPVNVAKSAASSAGRAGRSLVDAVREGRAAAAQREAELKAERDAKEASVAGLTGTGAAGQTPVQIVVVDARDADVLRSLDQIRAARESGRRRRADEATTSRRRRRR